MKRFASIFFAVLFFVAVMVASEPRALAYVDPGSGLVIYQTVGALATAGLFWFRRRFRSLFTRSASSVEKPEQPS